MGQILSIETATRTCSVAIAKDGELLGYQDFHSEQYSHAEKLNSMMIDLMKELSLSWGDIDAIAVSEGPGSYTGLRIGVSTAKGLCYARSLPLIAINSLASLASLIDANEYNYRCPMFDARRMEVYGAIYDKQEDEIMKTQPVLVDEFSFLEYLEKCQAVIQHKNAHFDLETEVSARGMVDLAERAYRLASFVDVAYFEPNYLKSF